MIHHQIAQVLIDGLIGRESLNCKLGKDDVRHTKLYQHCLISVGAKEFRSARARAGSTV